jgi:hypothetical protein
MLALRISYFAGCDGTNQIAAFALLFQANKIVFLHSFEQRAEAAEAVKALLKLRL